MRSQVRRVLFVLILFLFLMDRFKAGYGRFFLIDDIKLANKPKPAQTVKSKPKPSSPCDNLNGYAIAAFQSAGGRCD